MANLQPEAELRVVEACAHIAQKQCTEEVYQGLLYLKNTMEHPL